MEEGNLTAAEVVKVLGLPDTIDPLTFDAFASGVDSSEALAVEKASHQIMSVIMLLLQRLKDRVQAKRILLN